MNEGIWIPAEIWALDLPPLHRVFLSRLVALSKKDGASWAGDEFLAEGLNCTPQHVRKMRKQLEQSGYIVTEGYGRTRRLTVEVAPAGTSNHRRKQPQAQELQPQAQKLQPQLREVATTVAESIEENRSSIEVVKKGTPKKKKPEVVLPWDTDTFREVWDTWKAERRERRTKAYTARGEQAALHELYTMAAEDEATAAAIVKQSITKGWQGLFPLKNGKNGKPQLTADEQADNRRKLANYVKYGTFTPNGSGGV